MNKNFLATKQKFIKTLLSRYEFWGALVSHQTQTWTNEGSESRCSMIAGGFEPIRISALEHLTIAPLVFDYLDVTISLKFRLSDEPFKTKLNILKERLGDDLISRLIISTYEKLSTIRNKLLHQKGSLSDCGKIVIITKDALSIELNHLSALNSLSVMLARTIKDDSRLSLNEKSAMWSSFKIIFPIAADSILDIAKNENVVDINILITRHKIDMRPKSIIHFEDLRNNLYSRFLNEHGKLIGNTDFLFRYDGYEYSMPAEYLYKNNDITISDIRVWAIEKHT